ncbi:uncharacterized protein LOC110713912 [Chenopodium quinoa]|uniref:uncharacterized protein LOC110713912 n=1 Tax=Chenopodium quinoa TaxID=63459 RepID=UPI000B78C81B|nr:uncharacterized protein LOC110713912 [Chenopodium quinoa]
MRRRIGQEESGRAPSFKEIGDKWEEDTWRTERERKKNPQFFENTETRDSQSYKSSNTTSTWQEPARLNVHERLGPREPLEKVLGKVEKSGRLAKWAFELTEFSISYHPRTAIKAQALADFLAECSNQETLDEEKKIWTIFTDGSSTINGSRVGVVITSLEGKSFEYALKFSFKASNNEVAIAVLELCIALEAEHVCLKTDSQLVANQIRGEYEAKKPSMIAYLAKIKTVIVKLRTLEVELIPRAELDGPHPSLQASRINSRRQKLSLQTEENQLKVHRLQRRAAEKVLSPTTKVCGTTDADYMLREIHLGICENYNRGRVVAHKALRAGYYWPTMILDVKELVRKCEKCQKFASVIHQPTRDLQPILNPLPFAQWGLDILGPFPDAPHLKRWLIVGIDYFSKWIKAEAAANITEQTVRKFIWQNNITRFGIPKVLVFDHGRQFDNFPLRWYTDQFGIKLAYSAVCHPQSNGQAEATNKQILNALK